MGAPGAGKGTQARLLEERLHLPQISTGDIFRSLRQSDSSLAREVREVMDSGKLVPDELTIRLVKDRTSHPDAAGGYILDGFPRTPAQAVSLEHLAVEQGNEIIPILIDVPLDLLEKRTTGRRNCPVCGEIYNIYFKPPKFDNRCDFHPDAVLVQRGDDYAETVHARLATYEEQTRPLIDYYLGVGLLRTVDGTGEPDAIHENIRRIIQPSDAVVV